MEQTASNNDSGDQPPTAPWPRSTLYTSAKMMITDGTDRYKRGLDVLQKVGGTGYSTPLDGLRNLAPDLARFIVELAYGDVMSRPGLDLKTRQICTVAALTALGNARLQLVYHVAGALNVGCEWKDIVEVMILATVYAGFPAALNGVAALREVLKRRAGSADVASGLLAAVSGGPANATSEGERRARGERALAEVSGGAGAAVIAGLEDIAPELGRFILEYSYGDVIARPGLDPRTRELATVAMLTAVGTAAPQLRVHVHAALNVGASRDAVIEVVQQMAVYAGFPAALNGITALREVFAQHPA